jgi:hypothetical protein
MGVRPKNYGLDVIASGGRDLSNIYRWPGSLAGSPATRVRPTRNRHFEFHERLKVNISTGAIIQFPFAHRKSFR